MRINVSPIAVVVLLLISCETENSMPSSQRANQVVGDDVLRSDLASFRRDRVRMATLYLHDQGAPAATVGEGTHDDWQRIGFKMSEWLDAQSHNRQKQLLDGYPNFKFVQSPYYSD